ncbi:MAG: selenium-dependent xanthine dehydrogenase [Candidatus Cloacimonetes bacterium 4572_55]|nr:MAG: selenium-dependent xanthine dehydrogenase [Candidatus Cloacimonetes bacterium 4572_55]
MEFTLNSVKKTYHSDPNLTLLDYLREQERILSPKDGCSGQGACGACTVELNGKAILSCVTPMHKVSGLDAVTIEGIGDFYQQQFVSAFSETGAVQCGFCTPGIVMRAKVLLDHNPDPTLADIRKALHPHLCRCTGYKKIEEAILIVAKALRSGKDSTKDSRSAIITGKVGERVVKYDADKLTLGQRPFVADLQAPGMLHAALKFSDHPRAKVLSIDVSQAENFPGVVRIFTAKDIPGDRMTGLIIPDWPLMIDVGETTRYVGDALAGVVAESESIARQAARLIRVAYQVLPPIVNSDQALREDTPRIHPNGNLLSETAIQRGNAEDALAQAEYVSHGVYRTQMVEHGFLETECCLAQPKVEDSTLKMEVYSQGQGVYEDQKQIAKILAIPIEKVRVILVPNGGGFGGKEDLTVQGHAALYSYLLQKPVKARLTRDESIRMHPKRHPLTMEYTLGCDKNGKLVGLKARIVGDTGAYASVGMKVLERAAGHSTGAYHIPHVDVESRAVYTNNLPCGAMRGFGVNQVTFAIESCMDDLCEKGEFDRWQFRYDNALKPGDVCATGQIMNQGCGVRETLSAVKDRFYQAKYAGIACGIKNTGIGNGMEDSCRIKIEIAAVDRVIIHHGWTEMGQGIYTVAVQFLCDQTGIDPAHIEVRVDTEAQAEAGMTTASRGSSLIGHALLDGCRKLNMDLKKSRLADLIGKIYVGEWVCDWTTKPGADVEEIITHYSYGFATQVVTLDHTGSVVEAVYAAHDAGRIINPTLFEGQIQGSVHMGLGYALREELELENSVPKHTRLRRCGILRARETPDIFVIGVEKPDPNGPLGVKGVGEIGLTPTAAAVANAMYQYDKIRRYELPLMKKSRRLS